MIKKRYFLPCLFLLINIVVYGQEINYKGFELQVSTSIYWGNKTNAYYYAGQNTEGADPNLARVLQNKYYREEIATILENNYHGINALDFDLAGLSDMRYKAGFNFSIGLKYNFSENIALTLNFSQARLSAIGEASLSVPSSAYNTGGKQMITSTLLGKERRNFFGLDFTYMFRNESRFFPFFEIGAHLNSTKVVSSDIIIENIPFNLIDYYGGVAYIPNTSIQEIDPHLGGIGYGFNFTIGLKIAFTRVLSLEPLFSVCLEKVHLAPPYDKIRPNFNLGLRFYISDRIFVKK